MTSYVGETALRELLIETLRGQAPAVTDVRLLRRTGPFVPGNWRIDSIVALARDDGEARALADRLEAAGQWIAVPDRHPLDGQVFGREVSHHWAGPGD